MFIETKEGIIKSIDGVEKARNIDNVVEIEIYKVQGEKVGDVKSSNDRIGHIISIGNSPEEARISCREAMQLIKVRYEELM